MSNAKKQKTFLCDWCGDEKTGKKHKVYDENWNLQRGVFNCDDCFIRMMDEEIENLTRNEKK